MPRTNPSTGNGRKPKAVKAPPSTTIPIAPLPVPLNRDRSDLTRQSLTGLNLPDRLSANLSNFSSLVNVSDVGTPSSFDAAGWQRVTDSQRVVDERHYRELKNYAHNIKDGVDTLSVMAQAAVAATEFGKTLIRYATGVEGMNTEAVRFQIQQADSEIATAKLAGKAIDLHYQNDLNRTHQTKYSQDIEYRDGINQTNARQYQADLDTLAIRLDGTLRKNEFELLEVEHKYPQFSRN